VTPLPAGAAPLALALAVVLLTAAEVAGEAVVATEVTVIALVAWAAVVVAVTGALVAAAAALVVTGELLVPVVAVTAPPHAANKVTARPAAPEASVPPRNWRRVQGIDVTGRGGIVTVLLLLSVELVVTTPSAPLHAAIGSGSHSRP
jgi:hypothetical protein